MQLKIPQKNGPKIVLMKQVSHLRMTKVSISDTIIDSPYFTLHFQWFSVLSKFASKPSVLKQYGLAIDITLSR